MCWAMYNTAKPQSSSEMANHNLPWSHTKGPLTFTQPDMAEKSNIVIQTTETNLQKECIHVPKKKKQVFFPGLSATSSADSLLSCHGDVSGFHHGI